MKGNAAAAAPDPKWDAFVADLERNLSVLERPATMLPNMTGMGVAMPKAPDREIHPLPRVSAVIVSFVACCAFVLGSGFSISLRLPLSLSPHARSQPSGEVELTYACGGMISGSSSM